MVTIGMNYKVLPGIEEVFEKACTGVIEAMNGIDGHEKSFLYKDVNDIYSPCSNIIVYRQCEKDDLLRYFLSPSL